MDQLLYGADGFYTQGGRPGLFDGHFGTSPERGELFGRCVASYLDSVWNELGQPDPFFVVEGGAGVGSLCRSVLAAKPACARSLRYLMVERSDVLRAEAQDRLSHFAVELSVETAADLPTSLLATSSKPAGVVIANELLDNLAVRILRRSPVDGWQELYVTGQAATFQPAPTDAAAMADALIPNAPPGTTIPLQLKANVWVRRAIELVKQLPGGGRVLIIDYGAASTAELAQRTPQSSNPGWLPDVGWLRTYAHHHRNPTAPTAPADQSAAPAATDITCDLTCDIALDQLPSGFTRTTQADWLAKNGLHQLTAPHRHRWQAERTSPTAATLKSRSVLDEAADLTKPTGLGGFYVLEWHIPAAN